jgi:hypothetical protein
MRNITFGWLFCCVVLLVFTVIVFLRVDESCVHISDECRIKYYLGTFEPDDAQIIQDYGVTLSNVPESMCVSRTLYMDPLARLLKENNAKDKYFYLLPGDQCESQGLYALSKSRSVHDKKATLLRSLEFYRHWLPYYLPTFDPPFSWKINKLIWRGTTTGRKHRSASRFQCVTRWYQQHPKIDVGFSFISQHKNEYQSYVNKNHYPLLFYKYILSIEGNDKDSGLNWKLNSNSVVFMAKPTCVSWLMEDQLIPNHHYVLVKDDFSDLYDRYKWCEDHPSECRRIIKNANCFMRMFRNIQNEQHIERQVLNRYINNVNNPASFG